MCAMYAAMTFFSMILVIMLTVYENEVFLIAKIILIFVASVLWLWLFISTPRQMKIKEEKNRQKALAEEENKRLRTLAREELLDKFLRRIRWLINPYRLSLGRERSRLVTQDAYGVSKYDKWHKDGIEYFINNVLIGLLNSSEKELLTRFYSAVVSVIENEAYGAEGKMNSTIDFNENMSGVEFENLCKELLVTHGWDARITKKSGDQGVDIIAKRKNVSVAIQCKRSKAAIGNKAVQEIVSGAKHYYISNPIVVTNSIFTPSAKSLAKTNGVLLLHYSELKSLYNLLIS